MVTGLYNLAFNDRRSQHFNMQTPQERKRFQQVFEIQLK